MTVLLAIGSITLLPAESLAQNPERYRCGNKEQAKPNWASPAEPRTPRPPVFQAVFVDEVEVLLVVLATFTLVLHSAPFVT